MQNRCVVCGEGSRELTLLEQYGPDYLYPLCWEHYSEINAEANCETSYGLGPHEHTYDENGNIVIGGTKFLPLPQKDENGEYDFGDRTFHPDPEAPGCGIWQMKPLPGWR